MPNSKPSSEGAPENTAGESKEPEGRGASIPKSGFVVLTPQMLGPDLVGMLRERAQRERAERQALDQTGEKE